MSTNSILAISLIAVLLVGVVSFDNAFADHKPSHQSNAGGVPNLQTQVDENTASVDSFFDVFTELQTDVDTIYGHVTVLKGQSDPFFDVFYETFSVDSFFDIFTELQTDVETLKGGTQDINIGIGELQAKTTDNMMGVNENTARIDSFFDVFTEVSVHDADIDNLQAQIHGNEAGTLKGDERSLDADNQHDKDIARIDTEILSMDLRGQSCGVGDVVTGVDANGELLCATGSGDTSALQEQIDELDVRAEQLDIRTESLNNKDQALQSELDVHVTVLKAKDTEHDADIARIDTEILSMDLRGQSCSAGDVVTGVDANGDVICAPDAQGSGDTSELEARIVLLEANVVDCTARGVGVDLHGCDFRNADLSGVNLSRADLSRADLNRADLKFTNLRNADLSFADLSTADLSTADLSGADLFNADLNRADLSGADLSFANLSSVDLFGANLSSADLFGANLSCFNHPVCI